MGLYHTRRTIGSTRQEANHQMSGVGAIRFDLDTDSAVTPLDSYQITHITLVLAMHAPLRSDLELFLDAGHSRGPGEVLVGSAIPFFQRSVVRLAALTTSRKMKNNRAKVVSSATRAQRERPSPLREPRPVDQRSTAGSLAWLDLTTSRAPRPCHSWSTSRPVAFMLVRALSSMLRGCTKPLEHPATSSRPRTGDQDVDKPPGTLRPI